MSASPGTGPFVINVAGLLGDDVGSKRTVEIRDATIDLPDELELAAPIEGTIRLTHENRGVLVGARLTTALAGECARCLRPLQTPIEIVLDEEYLPSTGPIAPACASSAGTPSTRARTIIRTMTSTRASKRSVASGPTATTERGASCPQSPDLRIGIHGTTRMRRNAADPIA